MAKHPRSGDQARQAHPGRAREAGGDRHACTGARKQSRWRCRLRNDIAPQQIRVNGKGRRKPAFFIFFFFFFLLFFCFFVFCSCLRLSFLSVFSFFPAYVIPFLFFSDALFCPTVVPLRFFFFFSPDLPSFLFVSLPLLFFSHLLCLSPSWLSIFTPFLVSPLPVHFVYASLFSPYSPPSTD